MPRGEVRYRLTLDSNVVDQANKSAAAMKQAGADSQAALTKMGGAWDDHTSKMGKVAGAVDMTAKKLAGLGEAAGLPAKQLRVLSDVADVADIGLSNLSKSAAGFNSASIGVAGAGLAVGTAIGSWLNTFPAVQQKVDSLRDSLLSLFNVQSSGSQMTQAMSGMAEFQKRMNESNAQAFETVRARLLAQGRTVEEIAAMYNQKAAPAMKSAADRATELVEAHKKAAAAAEKHAAAAKKLAEETDRANKAMAAEMFSAGTLHGGMGGLGGAFSFGARALNKADLFGIDPAKPVESIGLGPNFGNLLNQQFGVYAASAGKQFKIDFGKAVEGLGSAILGAIMGGGNVGAAVGASLGGSLGADLGKAIASGLGGAIGKALGSLAGPLGAALGGLAGGLFGKLFGGSEEKKINPLRQQFVDAAGGLDALNKKAKESGLTLDRLLNAKTVKEYEAAIRELTTAFDLQATATHELDAAAEKYGLTTKNQIDMQGVQLLKEHELLMTQFSQKDVLEHMGPALNDYVQQAVKAGQAIPENFRPILEEMVKMGLLTDENGKAFETLEDAGITFTESLTDGIKGLIDEIKKLVSALTGVPTSLPNYGGQGGEPPAHGGPHGGEHYGQGGYTPPGPEVPAWVGTSGGEYHVPGGPEWMQQLAGQIAANMPGAGPVVVGPFYLGSQKVQEAFACEIRNGGPLRDEIDRRVTQGG